MPPFLATCHVLALLESPIDEEQFAQEIANNPFFRDDCVNPRVFLGYLTEMGLLTETPTGYVLSAHGQVFERYVLQWNRHTPAARAVHSKRQALPPRERLASQCPHCESRYCALYLFVALYTRFQWGLSGDNLGLSSHEFWPFIQALDLPFQHFYYWDQRLCVLDCNDEEQQWLASQWPARFLGALKTHWTQREPLALSFVDYPLRSALTLPFYQYAYRVLAADLLQQVQALRYPQLSAYLDPQAPPQLGLLHLGPVLRDPTEHRVCTVVRCNAQLRIYEWVQTTPMGFQLVSLKKAC